MDKRFFRNLSKLFIKETYPGNMEILNRLITSTLPHYLTNLPIPKSVLGFIQLSGIYTIIWYMFY
jgi:hypothetical protein